MENSENYPKIIPVTPSYLVPQVVFILIFQIIGHLDYSYCKFNSKRIKVTKLFKEREIFQKCRVTLVAISVDSDQTAPVGAV